MFHGAPIFIPDSGVTPYHTTLWTPIHMAKTKQITAPTKTLQVSDDKTTTILKTIKNNPGLTPRHYSELTDATVLQVNAVINGTDEGMKLARAAKIAITQRGRKPFWFHNLSKAKQAQVPVVSEFVSTYVNYDGSSLSDKGVARDYSDLSREIIGDIARSSMSPAAKRARVALMNNRIKGLAGTVDGLHAQLVIEQQKNAEIAALTADGLREEVGTVILKLAERRIQFKSTVRTEDNDPLDVAA